jgi:hypothetical protein
LYKMYTIVLDFYLSESDLSILKWVEPIDK